MSPVKKALIIERHFKKKFKTSEKKKRLKQLNDLDWLEDDNFKIKTEDIKFLKTPIKKEELDLAISELDESKACGLDGITPQMLKNMGTEMEERLLKLFNYVWLTGRVPEDWKKGEVVLLSKRAPVTDISNYRYVGKILEKNKL